MPRKFYTADWHLNSEIVRASCNRPFPDIDYMNKVLVSACNYYAGKDDIVVHVGDLLTYGKDRDTVAPKDLPSVFLSQVDATFVNIAGNHDERNKVKSIGTCLRTSLGPFSDVSVSHYPSYDERAAGQFMPGDIHLCGHVHGKWKHHLDRRNKVLNVNVGVDVWNYHPVSEDTLVSYIRTVMREFLKAIGDGETRPDGHIL